MTSWAKGAALAACALSLAGCVNTIYWEVDGPEAGWATINVAQKNPTFEVLSLDGAEQYPTEDGENRPFADDFERLAIKVMPGEHQLVLICRYLVHYKSRRTSYGKLESRQYGELNVTRTVVAAAGAEILVDFDNTCPEEGPCTDRDCAE